MIIVCDTNILISAFIFPGGPPDKVWRHVVAGQVSNVISPDLVTEFKGVLLNKFELPELTIERYVRHVTDVSRLVYPIERLAVITEDPSDNRVLETASVAEANYIISGDKRHLLPLRSFKGTSIVTANQFLVTAGII